MYPSEYAYQDDSVSRAERNRANCRRYPERAGDSEVVYIHCDGEQLRLTNSDIGADTEYSIGSYYSWSIWWDAQLLFTFPTVFSLTTITLHYYSDSDRGLPRLRFYAVLDDIDVWDTLATGTPYADIAEAQPGVEPAGRRSVSINVNFNTRKVLMYKYHSSFIFTVSEMAGVLRL